MALPSLVFGRTQSQSRDLNIPGSEVSANPSSASEIKLSGAVILTGSNSGGPQGTHGVSGDSWVVTSGAEGASASSG